MTWFRPSGTAAPRRLGRSPECARMRHREFVRDEIRPSSRRPHGSGRLAGSTRAPSGHGGGLSSCPPHPTPTHLRLFMSDDEWSTVWSTQDPLVVHGLVHTRSAPCSPCTRAEGVTGHGDEESEADRAAPAGSAATNNGATPPASHLAGSPTGPPVAPAEARSGRGPTRRPSPVVAITTGAENDDGPGHRESHREARRRRATAQRRDEGEARGTLLGDTPPTSALTVPAMLRAAPDPGATGTGRTRAVASEPRSSDRAKESVPIDGDALTKRPGAVRHNEGRATPSTPSDLFLSMGSARP